MHRSKMHSPFNHLIGANQRRFRDYGPRAPSGVLSVITNSTSRLQDRQTGWLAYHRESLRDLVLPQFAR